MREQQETVPVPRTQTLLKVCEQNCFIAPLSCCPLSTDIFCLFGQFTRLNAVYRERKKQLAEGVDVLKDKVAQDSS